MKFISRTLSAFIFSILVFSASTAHAAVINPGFESGDFTGWSSIGEVLIAGPLAGSVPSSGPGTVYDADGNVVSPGAVTFTGTGNYQALLGTGIDSSDPDPVSAGLVESFFGLPAGTFVLMSGNVPADGSGIKQDITVNAGDTLSFDWSFITNRTPANPLNDFAFFTVGPTALKLADTFYPEFFQADLLDFTTGVRTFTYSFPSAGLYTIGVGVIETTGGDTSALLFDNVRLTTSGVPSTNVPEPATFFLVLTGAILGSRLNRRFGGNAVSGSFNRK